MSDSTDTSIVSSSALFDQAQLTLMSLEVGHIDELLDTFEHVIRKRKEAVAAAKAATLRVGDQVTISNNVKPKYLAGARCEVIGYENGQVKVKMLEGRGRFHYGSEVRLPNSLIG